MAALLEAAGVIGWIGCSIRFACHHMRSTGLGSIHAYLKPHLHAAPVMPYRLVVTIQSDRVRPSPAARAYSAVICSALGGHNQVKFPALRPLFPN